MVAHTCNHSPWEVELDLEIQGLPWVQNQPKTPAWAETYLKKTNLCSKQAFFNSEICIIFLTPHLHRPWTTSKYSKKELCICLKSQWLLNQAGACSHSPTARLLGVGLSPWLSLPEHSKGTAAANSFGLNMVKIHHSPCDSWKDAPEWNNKMLISHGTCYLLNAAELFYEDFHVPTNTGESGAHLVKSIPVFPTPVFSPNGLV